MSTTRPPAHRSRSPQPLPAESVPSVSADWIPWHEQRSGGSVLQAQVCTPQASLYTGGPEAALLQAVLADALACLQRQGETERRGVQHMAWEAEAWFCSADSHWLFSVVAVCAVLGLEPASLRQVLKRWSQSPRTRRRDRGSLSSW